MGEAEAVDADGLEGADLDAAVAAVAGAVQHRDAMPGQALAARQQRGLVGLDTEQVVGVLVADQELGGLRVGLEGVGRDHGPGEVEIGQQWSEGRDLFGCATDLALGQHPRVVWSMQASRCAGRPSAPTPRAPRRVLPSIATARRRLAAGLGHSRSRSASHAPTAAARASASRRARVRRMVASAGTAKWPGASRRAPSAARTGWGASAAPFGDRGDRPRAGQHRGGGHPQGGDQRMAAPTGSSRVGDSGQVGEQVWGVGVLRLDRVGVGEVDQRGWDWG